MLGLNEDKALADDSVPRTNWSGNYHYSTNRVLQSASVAEPQDAVRSVAGVRALGTRHSFNGEELILKGLKALLQAGVIVRRTGADEDIAIALLGEGACGRGSEEIAAVAVLRGEP